MWAVLGKSIKISCWLFTYVYINKEKTTKKFSSVFQKIKYSHMPLSATLDLLFSCLLACLRCHTLVDTNVLPYELCWSAGPIERCSAVLTIREWKCCGFRWAVGAFVVYAAEEKQVQKRKTSGLFVFLGGHNMGSRADDTASFDSVSRKRAPPQQSCLPRVWYVPVPSLGLRRAPVSRTCHVHTNTRARFLLLLLWCCCIVIAVGCSTVTIGTTAA